MKELFKIHPYIWRYKRHFLLGILFVAIANIFSVIQPRLIRNALDLVVDKVKFIQDITDADAKAMEMSTLSGELLKFAGLVILCALVMGFFMYWMRQTVIVMSRLVEYDLKRDIFAHYTLLDQSFYRKQSTGDMMSRLTEDVSKVRMYVGPALLYGINLVTLFSFVIYSMVSINRELALWCLIPLPFLSLAIYLVSSVIHKKSTLIQEQLAKLNSLAQEVYSGIRVLKSYVHEKQINSYFGDESEEYKQRALSLARTNAMFHPLMVLISGATTIIVVFVGGLKVANGAISPGTIAEFVIYVGMLTWPVTAIGWIASIIQQASASQKRINHFLDVEPKIPAYEASGDFQLNGSISFKDVGFTYPDTGIKALKNVNFTIEPGERVAIIGKTGSGKTALVELLVRLFDPNEGKILIDGQALPSLNLVDYRDRLGLVSQDVFLFSDTITNNIKYGNGAITEEKMYQYAQYASIHDEILRLPEQYDTRVGERGVSLSGGQKQRISIARALVKDPDIVILDDCLSAVDAHTERAITDFLNDELSGKTCIIITHRLSTSFEYDKIIVLEDGEVAASGSHSELYGHNDYYTKMIDKTHLEN